MNGDAYSFYCKKNSWERCAAADLIVVKILVEKHNADGELTEKVAIYRCRVCGGFYKQKYSAIYYHPYHFDTEEGWSVTDKYFKIEAPLWSGLNSSGEIPLTIEEARGFGYTGADLTWKNGRCNFEAQNVELTCRARDLRMVAYLSPESNHHNSEKFYKCLRCGEWYFFKVLPPYTEALLKPSNELFPIEAARVFGYEENAETPFSKTDALPQTDISTIEEKEFLDESLIEAWKEPEILPAAREWLNEPRAEAAQAQYASIIMKKHFARENIELKLKEIPLKWWQFYINFYTNISEFVRAGTHPAMLKDLFAEVIGFSDSIPDEFSAYRVFKMFEHFIDRDPPYSKIAPLLPPEFFEKASEIDKIQTSQHEEDIERQNQMGY